MTLENSSLYISTVSVSPIVDKENAKCVGVVDGVVCACYQLTMLSFQHSGILPTIGNPTMIITDAFQPDQRMGEPPKPRLSTVAVVQESKDKSVSYTRWVIRET